MCQRTSCRTHVECSTNNSPSCNIVPSVTSFGQTPRSQQLIYRELSFSSSTFCLGSGPCDHRSGIVHVTQTVKHQSPFCRNSSWFTVNFQWHNFPRCETKSIFKFVTLNAHRMVREERTEWQILCVCALCIPFPFINSQVFGERNRGPFGSQSVK